MIFPPLYHWSPRERRKQIERYGLRPRMRPTTHSDSKFLAPHVCFAESPSWAWSLSGRFHEDEQGLWDLWQVNVNGYKTQVVKTFDKQHRWHEVRVLERVYKRSLWYVGTKETFG